MGIISASRERPCVMMIADRDYAEAALLLTMLTDTYLDITDAHARLYDLNSS
jgi:hypothetical protein